MSTLRYSDLVMRIAQQTAPDKIVRGPSPEPLARLPYAVELEIKNKALQEFWTAQGLPDKPNQILPSPLPRHYRTTTKRRVIYDRSRYYLDFLPEKKAADSERLGAASELEPKEHAAIYAMILAKLNSAAYTVLGHALNYLVIRGDYKKFSVFFNVHKLSAPIVRKAKLLADHLHGEALQSAPGFGGDARVTSAYLFYDPSRSPFYLDQRSPDGPWKLKKLFGPDNLHVQIKEKSYAYHPTAFCQVNGSILPLFLEKAEQLLKPRPEQRLLDLYCGFGLFSLHLAPSYTKVIGVDAASVSIQSAMDMAKADPKTKCVFQSGRIHPKSLDRLLPPADRMPESILLDPPRQGVEPGVIRSLAERAPMRILHIFCDMETLPKEVNQWRKAGYMVSKVVPLDMFPGTDNLEVMVLFIPDRYGILNRVDKTLLPEKMRPRSERPIKGPRRNREASSESNWNAGRPNPRKDRKGQRPDRR